jgi:hypothetical protein
MQIIYGFASQFIGSIELPPQNLPNNTTEKQIQNFGFKLLGLDNWDDNCYYYILQEGENKI